MASAKLGKLNISHDKHVFYFFQTAYFGNAHVEPEEFFQQFGLVCEPHFNPADFYRK